MRWLKARTLWLEELCLSTTSFLLIFFHPGQVTWPALALIFSICRMRKLMAAWQGLWGVMSRKVTCAQVQMCWPDDCGGSGTNFMEALGFRADERLDEGEVTRHWQLRVIWKKVPTPEPSRLKQILFLTFLLFYLLSLGNLMVPIYTLITLKAMSHGLDDQGWVPYSLVSLEILLYQSSLSTLNKMITFVWAYSVIQDSVKKCLVLSGT